MTTESVQGSRGTGYPQNPQGAGVFGGKTLQNPTPFRDTWPHPSRPPVHCTGTPVQPATPFPTLRFYREHLHTQGTSRPIPFSPVPAPVTPGVLGGFWVPVALVWWPGISRPVAALRSSCGLPVASPWILWALDAGAGFSGDHVHVTDVTP